MKSWIVCAFFSSFSCILFTSCLREDADCSLNDIYVIAYTEPNFKGDSETFQIGVHSYTTFTKIGNNQISSIKINSSKCVKVTLCEDTGPSANGICREFTESQRNLDDLENKVSYVEVEYQ